MESTKTWIAGEAIAEAVNAANLFRKIYGKDLLTDLPKARAGEPEECVLAKAFNFDCAVNARDDIWFILFPTEEKDKADNLATILNTTAVRSDQDGYTYGEVADEEWLTHYKVDLPEKIGKIASEFDSGALEDKYYTMNADGLPVGVAQTDWFANHPEYDPRNDPTYIEDHLEDVVTPD